jgi:hypothetical protein
MRYGIIALMLLAVASACLAADGGVGPYSYDPSYGAWPQPACGACLPGVTPALSHSIVIAAPPAIAPYPEVPWLKVRVNGRMTPLGPSVAMAKGEPMIPVTAVVEFGLSPTRAADNYRVMTLSGAEKSVVLTVGSRAVKIGAATFTLPVAPMWMKGKVYMPVVAVGKLLGWTFTMHPETGIVDVATH